MVLQVPGPDRTAQQGTPGGRASWPGRFLPGWATVLVVVAHPDDESFGLGAIISHMAAAGAAAHILCYTHGEASTLNENRADLDTEREAELRQHRARRSQPHPARLPRRPPGSHPAGGTGRPRHPLDRPPPAGRPARLRRHRRHRPPRSPGSDPRRCAGRHRRGAASACLGPPRGNRRPAARRDRPAVHRASARSPRPVHPAGPHQATPRRPRARQPDLPRRGALATAAAARRLRAPALAAATTRLKATGLSCAAEPGRRCRGG